MDAFAIFSDAIGTALTGGIAALQPHALNLCRIFATLGAVWLCFTMMFHHHNLVGSALKFTIFSAFWMLVVGNVGPIGETLLTGAVDFGLIVSHSNQSAQDFLTGPGSMFQEGARHASNIFKMASDVCQASFTGCIGVIDTWLPLMLTGFLIVVVYGVTGILILLLVLAFWLSAIGGMVSLPAILFPPTADIGMLPIKGAIHTAIRLMCLAIVVNFNSAALDQMTIIPDDPTFANVLPLFLDGFFMLGLVMTASKMGGAAAGGFSTAVGGIVGAPAGMATTAARSLINAARNSSRNSDSTARMQKAMDAASRRGNGGSA